MLLTGHGKDDFIEQISGIESADKLALRKKYTRSAKDVLNHVLAYTSKIFNSKGGSLSFEMTNKVAEEKFKDVLDDITQGISLDKWLENYFLFAYQADPNGIFFIESPKEGEEENENAYPTYKSISHIHDYKSDGQDLEYVIFVPEKMKIPGSDRMEKVYRVVDDEKDALYYVDNEKLMEYSDEENGISHAMPTNGKVPAFIVGDIVDHNTRGYKSILDPIAELLQEYILETGVKSVFKKLHGYPVFYRYVTDCRECGGDGFITDPDSGESHTCYSCHGTGKNLNKDVSDTLDFEIPEHSDQPVITPDVAGYVSPSNDTWKQMTEEQKFMIDLLNLSFWNATIEKKNNETATGRFIDVQPVHDKLGVYASALETVKGKIIDLVGKKTYPDFYEGCKCIQGRRFLVETPDQIWEKYEKARESGSSVVILDFLFKQFLYSEFHKDQEMIDQKLKEFSLEPFPHYDIMQLHSAGLNEAAQRKIFFNEWVVISDLSKPLETLLTERDKYIKERLAPLELPPLNNSEE